MNFIIWLVVGGIVGWVASMIMRRDAQQGVILNISWASWAPSSAAC